MTHHIWPIYSADAISKVASMLAVGDSYATSEHPAISELESGFMARFRLPGRGLFLGSGTAALFAGYYGLNLPADSEVLVPAYTFHATVTPLLALGLCPVLCDVDAQTGLLDLEDARRKMTPRTKALVVTHLWGQVVDMVAARQCCDEHGLYLVEDCSHAHGASAPDFRVGEKADFAAFSMGTKKLISGGLGGMLVTRSREIYERAVLLSQPKPRALALLESMGSPLRDYARTGLGFNLRGSPISAVLASDHLDRFSEIVRTKNANLRAVADILDRFLPYADMPAVPEDEDGTLYMFPVVLSGDHADRDVVVERLRDAGMRVGPLPGGLQREAFARDRRAALAGKVVARAAGAFPGVRNLERHGLRLDTRDMYRPWSRAQLENLAAGLQNVEVNGVDQSTR